ncbi:vitelline membrane protein 15a-3 [Culex quinquefasciatus]|nr:vitelline membrane protein 15a-3 [Culex quinquefasciatus]XP_039437205.1 vitelline membrane protein 15a-3-like [Culex pipiens pallens]
MNKFIALAVFSTALVGALANYAPAAPAKYEAPKASYGGGHGGYAAPAAASYGGGHASGGYGGHGGYGGGHGGAVPVVHTYAAQAPAAKCGANLLVGCAPSVAHVPCVPVHGGGHGGYGAAHGGSYGGASYGGASHGASYGGASHGASYGAPAAHGGYRASEDGSEPFDKFEE